MSNTILAKTQARTIKKTMTVTITFSSDKGAQDAANFLKGYENDENYWAMKLADIIENKA